jgi:hypothetical protein
VPPVVSGCVDAAHLGTVDTFLKAVAEKELYLAVTRFAGDQRQLALSGSLFWLPNSASRNKISLSKGCSPHVPYDSR